MTRDTLAPLAAESCQCKCNKKMARCGSYWNIKIVEKVTIVKC